jgi:HSP20 family protein
MSMLRIDPFRSFERPWQKMTQILNDVEKGINFEYGSFKPRVDIAEDNNNIYVYAELPGISREQVKVSVNEDNILIIKGEKKTVHMENHSLHRVERTFGEFERSFILPDNLKTDQINAKFEDGLLEIAIPKIEPPKPKEIEITL